MATAKAKTLAKTKVEVVAPLTVRSFATLTIVETQLHGDRKRLSIMRHGIGRANELVEAVTASIEKSLRENPEYEFPKG